MFDALSRGRQHIKMLQGIIKNVIILKITDIIKGVYSVRIQGANYGIERQKKRYSVK